MLRRKIKQKKGFGRAGGGVSMGGSSVLDGMITKRLTEVTFEQRSAESKGLSHAANWERRFQTKETSARALRQECARLFGVEQGGWRSWSDMSMGGSLGKQGQRDNGGLEGQIMQ